MEDVIWKLVRLVQHTGASDQDKNRNGSRDGRAPTRLERLLMYAAQSLRRAPARCDFASWKLEPRLGIIDRLGFSEDGSVTLAGAICFSVQSARERPLRSLLKEEAGHKHG